MQNEEKVLNLTLNKKWFDLIASGIKLEEYREIKPYWWARFREWNNSGMAVFIPYATVSATNGYGAHRPNIKWQHLGIRIGTGNPEWGAEPGKVYFCLQIGEIISRTNLTA